MLGNLIGLIAAGQRAHCQGGRFPLGVTAQMVLHFRPAFSHKVIVQFFFA